MNRLAVNLLLIMVTVVLSACSGTQISTGDSDNAGGVPGSNVKSGAGKKSATYTPPAGRRMLAEDFSSNLRSGATVVYFSKVSCPACKQQDKIWERVTGKLPAGVKAEKRYTYAVNYRAYGVTQLPTLVFYRDGVEVQRSIGVTSENKIISGARKAL